MNQENEMGFVLKASISKELRGNSGFAMAAGFSLGPGESAMFADNTAWVKIGEPGPG